jgi:hypothetical protein
MIRLVLNWIIKALVILALNHFAWLALKSDGTAIGGLSWPSFGAAMLLAFVFIIIAVLTELFTLGCAGLLGRLSLGPIALWITAQLFPGMVGTTGFWQTVGAGFLIMLIGIPRVDQDD